MKTAFASWQFWALSSAGFAAITAIFAKVGIENVSSDVATFIRTVVILVVLGAILAATGQFQPLGSISGRTYLFLVLSGMATGASWRLRLLRDRRWLSWAHRTAQTPRLPSVDCR